MDHVKVAAIAQCHQYYRAFVHVIAKTAEQVLKIFSFLATEPGMIAGRDGVFLVLGWINSNDIKSFQ